MGELASPRSHSRTGKQVMRADTITRAQAQLPATREEMEQRLGLKPGSCRQVQSGAGPFKTVLDAIATINLIRS